MSGATLQAEYPHSFGKLEWFPRRVTQRAAEGSRNRPLREWGLPARDDLLLLKDQPGKEEAGLFCVAQTASVRSGVRYRRKQKAQQIFRNLPE